MEYIIGYFIVYLIVFIINVVILFHRKESINTIIPIFLFSFLWPMTVVGFHIVAMVEMLEDGQFK